MDPWVEKQEKRDMQKWIEEANMREYITDAQYGVPTKCPCGAGIIDDVSSELKYPRDRDWLPGSRYFSCSNYKDDGLHFSQPWVISVQEEVQYLRRQVEKMADEIKNLKLKTLKLSVSRGRN